MHFRDEVTQLGVLEFVLLEVSLAALFEHFFAYVEDHLMQKCSSFSIADTIKDIFGGAC